MHTASANANFFRTDILPSLSELVREKPQIVENLKIPSIPKAYFPNFGIFEKKLDG